jgi:carboxypeptidase Taq
MLSKLKEVFETEIGMVNQEEFYEGVNHPRRSLIRVEADELTYNLHVGLRFELELALFRDELNVADLPNAWDAGMEKNLGVRPTSQSDGVLQDMHWPGGMQGYFPTYTLGTLYAAAFYEKALEQLPGLEDEFSTGDTSRLLAWLRENIHSHGHRYPAKELAKKVLGEEMTPKPFLDYVKAKYGELYDVEL